MSAPITKVMVFPSATHPPALVLGTPDGKQGLVSATTIETPAAPAGNHPQRFEKGARSGTASHACGAVGSNSSVVPVVSEALVASWLDSVVVLEVSDTEVDSCADVLVDWLLVSDVLVASEDSDVLVDSWLDSVVVLEVSDTEVDSCADVLVDWLLVSDVLVASEDSDVLVDSCADSVVVLLDSENVVVS